MGTCLPTPSCLSTSGGPSFEERNKPHRKQLLALLKLGVPWTDALDMPLAEGDSLLLNYQEIIDPKPKKQKVRKKPNG